MGGVSVGFEGMRSFAVAGDNVSRDDLRYWLDKKPLYSHGLMKAAYGTFLSALIVIYESDRVADESADMFNVSWSRVSPTCVSLCNDFNSVYITGESDHNLGREAAGNSSGVWMFNFMTSLSFSLIEQIVGNNIWSTFEIGSVTLGLQQNYLGNGTLEVFYSNGYVFIKSVFDNNTWLYLDIETGFVHDHFIFNGISGLMFCYCGPITDNAWEYGNQLVNDSSNFIDYMFTELDIYLDGANDFILGVGGGYLITFGVAVLLASNPIGWATLGAIALVAIGTTLLVYSNDLNKGYTSERWLNFCVDVGLSVIPVGGMTFKIGKSILRKPLTGEVITTLINKNSKNIPYEIVMMDNMKVTGTIDKGYNTYVLFSQREAIIGNALGFTLPKKAFNFFVNLVLNGLTDYAIDNYYNNQQAN